jgi:hypothetical protein
MDDGRNVVRGLLGTAEIGRLVGFDWMMGSNWKVVDSMWDGAGDVDE